MNAFNEAQAKILAAGVRSAADWEPIGAYMETASFKRVGEQAKDSGDWIKDSAKAVMEG